MIKETAKNIIPLLRGNFFIGQLGVNNALCHGVLVFFIYLHRGWHFQINFAELFPFPSPRQTGSATRGFECKNQWLLIC